MAKPKLQFKAPAYDTELLMKQHSHSADIKLAIWAIAAIVVIVMLVFFMGGRTTGAYEIQPVCKQGQIAVEDMNDAWNLQQYQGYSCASSIYVPSIKCCSK